jgi:uncharacterized protein YggE
MRTLTRSNATVLVIVVAVAATVAAMSLASSGSRPARAADVGASATSDTVTVSGVGTVQGVPNQLTTTFGVHVTRSNVQDALNALATSVNKVLRALDHNGIAKKLTQTSNLNINQHYDNHGRPDAYDAFESVVARIKPLNHAGTAISHAATAAGNDVSVDGLSFDVTDDDALVSQARSAAFADAKDRAKQYAGLAGRSLGDVQKINETVQESQPIREPYPYAAAAAGSDNALKSVPLQAGQQPVTVTVTVVWTLS